MERLERSNVPDSLISRKALRKSQEEFYEIAKDETRAITALTLESVQKSVEPLRRVGYTNERLIQLLDDDLLITEPTVKKMVKEFLENLSP